jgi:dephospho-CoA kinase
VPFKVGLTGGIASGKTTVSNAFADLGVPIIDADVIARQLVAPGLAAYQQIREQFSAEVIAADGQINRVWLREKIFSDADAKRELEAILHPKIRAQMLQEITQLDTAYCIVSIPLLVESQMQDLLDRVLVIDVAESEQISRLTQRDQITTKQAQQILANQCSRAERLAIADDVIDNSGSMSDLLSKVTQLDAVYRKLV